MRVVVQRVGRASVTVDGEVRGRIGRGLLALVAFQPGDGTAEIEWMAAKLTDLRIFPDETGRMNLSVVDIDGAMLAIPQFTLYGDATRGRRPSFVGALDPVRAEVLYDEFMEVCMRGPVPVRGGTFGASMSVELVNDGPVTLVIDR
jgi:D-tyrosyl-tRNA(Tyr) deacylase